MNSTVKESNELRSLTNDELDVISGGIIAKLGFGITLGLTSEYVFIAYGRDGFRLETASS